MGLDVDAQCVRSIAIDITRNVTEFMFFAHRYLAGRGPVREPRAMLGTVTEWARSG